MGKESVPEARDGKGAQFAIEAVVPRPLQCAGDTIVDESSSMYRIDGDRAQRATRIGAHLLVRGAANGKIPFLECASKRQASSQLARVCQVDLLLLVGELGA